jgi:methionine transaminase
VKWKHPQAGDGTTIFSIMSGLAKEYDAINLSQGFPNFPPDPELIAFVNSALNGPYNQYAPMGGYPELLEILKEKHTVSNGIRISANEEITVTAGATQALFTAILSVTKPGDEVVFFEPAYDSYLPAIQFAGGVPKPVRLNAPFRIDWDYVNDLITPKTRAIIVNTPNNPGCYVWSKSDWESLESIVEGKGITVISDEVYEHIVFTSEGHISVLDRPALRNNSFAIYSFGKNFHVTGWKVGYAVGGKSLMKQFRNIHQYLVFSVHHPTQVALCNYLKIPENYLNLATFYKNKRDTFISACKGSSFEFLPSDGSYFILADYSGISDTNDLEFAKWLTMEVGVAPIPISPFYSGDIDGQRLIRFCFAKTDNTLEEAGNKLKAVKPIRQ